MPTRRNFLAVTGMLATAGCSSLGVSKPTSETTDTPEEILIYRDQSATISNPGYKVIELAPESDGEVVISYELSVKGDKNIDILGFEEDELEEYKSDKSKSNNFADYHPGLSSFNVKYEQNGYKVSPGRYGIVIDNTDYVTDATGEVSVKFTISVTRA